MPSLPIEGVECAMSAKSNVPPPLQKAPPHSPRGEPLRSPLRHHQRTPSIGRAPIKETLDASVSYEDDEDGSSGIRINQYLLKDEIGRGSFGAVHLAVDQEGQKYAVKEISKSRLRKRSQSQILRRRQSGGPFQRRSASEFLRAQEDGNPLYLIREEIAILKQLDHENVVNLIEVLDDPEGDSLYMVLEMCEKGVVMKVGLDESTKPYLEEQCRLWFRDMILGIEYLHAQGIVHRDIKPDNLLLTSDDVLKIVDFGVSEMFEKNTPMVTAKTAGSPAFLPPELCVAGHGDISGCAADVWSMGVTLFCLFFGHLPFNYGGVMDLYNAIKNDTVCIPESTNPQLVDLFSKILEKDPAKRIKLLELREHPWVTHEGEDTLLSVEENTADVIMPTEKEIKSAITKSIHNVMAVVRAIRKLRRLVLVRCNHKASKITTPSVTASPDSGSLQQSDHPRPADIIVAESKEIQPNSPLSPDKSQRRQNIPPILGLEIRMIDQLSLESPSLSGETQTSAIPRVVVCESPLPDGNIYSDSYYDHDNGIFLRNGNLSPSPSSPGSPSMVT